MRGGGRDRSLAQDGDGATGESGRDLALAAPAKINLGLTVTGKLAGGFHRIDTVFARLDLADEVAVTVDPADEATATAVLEPPRPGAPPYRPDELPVDERNLAVRAALAYLEAAGRTAAVTVRLRKGVPLAAGLGGGSSDAAAVLLALAELLPAGIDLPGLGLSLGSDVPFFLARLPAQRGRGRGEELTPVSLPPVPVVLVNPGVRVSAALAYSLVASTGEPVTPDRLARELAERSEPSYRNDLEPGVAARFPEVAEALDRLRESPLRGVAMSGSGSTCFGLAATDAEAARTARRLSASRPDWWVWSGRAAV